jgi:NitT/TauT family transport system substrate-binding protein
MANERTEGWNRRDFVRGMTLAGMTGFAGFRPVAAHAEPPPEITKLRLMEFPVTCPAPQYVAQELLYDEGFTDVRYVKYPTETVLTPAESLVAGEVDITIVFPPNGIIQIDAGAPLVALAGVHIGGVELVGNSSVKSVRDLKGKIVAIDKIQGDNHTFISMFAAYVGLDPQNDINWAIHPIADHARLLTEGKIDALLAYVPFSLELRAKKIGHVLVRTAADAPWSQYFCCLVTSTTEFVRKHPVATKRALRAILKGADLCVTQPIRVARFIADKGLTSYEYALQSVQELSYDKWREYDPEDAVRFYALRLHDIDMIKSAPQKIIAAGTDWRFLNELKRELKV